MLMQPLARKGGGALPPASKSDQTPAPVGGWNARDSIQDMPIKDAPILKNWFPGKSRIRVRRGSESHVTLIPTATESLLVYSSSTADKMFAAANNAIYDVSVAGELGAASVSGMSNNRWQYANMGTSGGRFLIAVNGVDLARKYDGSTWDTSVTTGTTSDNFVHINVFKRRLLFVVKNTLKFAYLDVESVAGAASLFDLAPVCKLGGYLMAIGTWTRDGGDGLDDIAVFYTSKGEVLLYQGTDPGDAEAWAHIGTFTLGEPVGRRCMERVGSDLLLISKDGFVPLSTALGTGRATGRMAISDKIQNAVNDATRDYGSNFGWQAVLYPRGQMLLFNIPTVEGEESEQYVANTNTGSWCQFTGWNASCFAVFNDQLYFGGETKVFKADIGNSDDGADIECDVLQASSNFGYRNLKSFKMVRPILTVSSRLTVAVTVNVDHETRNPNVSPSYTIPGGSEWNSSPWDTSPWSSGPSTARAWIAVDGIGYVGAIRMRLAANGFDVEWNSTDWIFEPGGIQ